MLQGMRWTAEGLGPAREGETEGEDWLLELTASEPRPWREGEVVDDDDNGGVAEELAFSADGEEGRRWLTGCGE